MKDLITRQLTAIYERLNQQGRLLDLTTNIDGVEIYDGYSLFAFSWAGVEVTILHGKIDEISFKQFDNLENFSWTNWIEDIEKLTN